MLGHYRLGHPNFVYLKKLFPSLFKNKDPVSFQYEVFQLSKHIRNSFLSLPYKSSEPFILIHSDVWGPSWITNITGNMWFISFIDDYIRIAWIFLMREKSEVGPIFKKFNIMIQTQFHTNVQVLKSNKACEYFEISLGKYFIDHVLFTKARVPIHHNKMV